MTFGFALLLSGWILLDAGWKGVTPFQVLQGVAATTKGPGGVLRETGQTALTAFVGSPSVPVGPESTEGEPTIRGAGKINKKGLKSKEAFLRQNHPELKPGIRVVTAIVLAAFPKLVITATTEGEHAEGSYHYSGRAVDLAPAGGMTPENVAYMEKVAKFVSSTLTHTLTEGIHNPGLSVKYKKKVPPSYWGSETWEAHRNHIHLAV